MKFEQYVNRGNERLRCGYTTGTAASMGAKACALALLKGEVASSVSITVPKGSLVTADVDLSLQKGKAVCRVLKDGGDDIDVTDGAAIITSVELLENGIHIEGGNGVGRVTKPGLDQAVGQAAINSVPRKMIEAELTQVAKDAGYMGGFSVTISVENGQILAKKTFNPNLGIVGGISILGTSGIVEPMSLEALKQSIETELNMWVACGNKMLLITPGNYGEDFLKEQVKLAGVPLVKCSNFIGDTLDMAQAKGVESVLLVGHIGKVVKLAAGIMNTHSKCADGRAEILAAHAALAGASRACVEEIMNDATVDSSLTVLKREGLYDEVVASLLCKIQSHLTRRSTMRVGAMTFSNVYGHIGTTQVGQELIEERVRNER